MTVEEIDTKDVTIWIVKGLRELATLLEDGLAENIHLEHYSETSATDKKYVLRFEYRKIEP